MRIYVAKNIIVNPIFLIDHGNRNLIFEMLTQFAIRQSATLSPNNQLPFLDTRHTSWRAAKPSNAQRFL